MLTCHYNPLQIPFYMVWRVPYDRAWIFHVYVFFFNVCVFNVISEQSAETKWQKVSILLSFGQWLYNHNFPKEDAKLQVQWVIDILLHMEPGKADGVGRTPCLVSLIVKQVSLTSFASSATVHSENLWGGGGNTFWEFPWGSHLRSAFPLGLSLHVCDYTLARVPACFFFLTIPDVLHCVRLTSDQSDPKMSIATAYV